MVFYTQKGPIRVVFHARKESIIESKAMRYLDSRCGSSSVSSGVFSDRKVLGGKVSPHLGKSPAVLIFNNVALQPRGKWKYIIFISSFPLLPSSPAGNWREGIYLEIFLSALILSLSTLEKILVRSLFSWAHRHRLQERCARTVDCQFFTWYGLFSVCLISGEMCPDCVCVPAVCWADNNISKYLVRKTLKYSGRLNLGI